MIHHFYDNPQFGENWFTFPNLYRYVVQKYDSGSVFVEVGSWKGRSSSFMCVEIANSQKSINFFCVDTWKGSKEHNVNEDLYMTFMKNMSPVKNFFTPWKMTSLEASSLFDDKSIDFVFIDASHEYEDVKTDIFAWYPKIRSGGIIAGHDYDDNWTGVKKAVNECFEKFFVNEGCWAVFLD